LRRGLERDELVPGDAQIADIGEWVEATSKSMSREIVRQAQVTPVIYDAERNRNVK
jgi:hypothetical protein